MKQIPNPYERRRIAEMVGVSPAYLYQCLTGRRDIDPVEAVRIEQETGGAISRFDVCLKRGRDIWPEIWGARVNTEVLAIGLIEVKPATPPSDPAQDAPGLRSGATRRHDGNRRGKIPAHDGGRRETGPFPPAAEAETVAQESAHG